MQKSKKHRTPKDTPVTNNCNFALKSHSWHTVLEFWERAGWLWKPQNKSRSEMMHHADCALNSSNSVYLERFSLPQLNSKLSKNKCSYLVSLGSSQ